MEKLQGKYGSAQNGQYVEVSVGEQTTVYKLGSEFEAESLNKSINKLSGTLIDKVNDFDLLHRYMSYCRSCALSGEHNPQSFEEFQEYREKHGTK